MYSSGISPKTALACFIACGAIATPLSAFGEDATVTFYTHGSQIKTGLPGSKSGIFWGTIYDGNQRLFSFYEGFVPKNNRFIIVRLPAGPHDFSASFDRHPSRKYHTLISLEPGKQYFFRAQSESRGIVIVESESGRLDQTTCQAAKDEATDARPLEPKHPSQALSLIRVPAASMPSCN